MPEFLINDMTARPQLTWAARAIVSAAVAFCLIVLSCSHFTLQRIRVMESVTDHMAILPPDETDDAIKPILSAGEAIRPLHTRKPPPKPGEWLATNHEAGQTFAEYRASRPNRPEGRRVLLYIQPIGTMTKDQKELMTETAEFLGLFYGQPVKTLAPIDLAVIPAKARRKHPEWGVDQIDSLYMLDLLKHRVPDDAVAVLGLTAIDLWPNEAGRKWNFVFGEASVRDRVGVWSICRLGGPGITREWFRLRTMQVATHETGHMLGILHCTAYECGMNGSNSLEESDRQPLGFCPECEMKIWWACRLDPARRYRRLAAFASENGFEQAAAGWRPGLARCEVGLDGPER